MADVDAGRDLQEPGLSGGGVLCSRRGVGIDDLLKLELRHRREGPQEVLLDVGVEAPQLLALGTSPFDIPILPA